MPLTRRAFFAGLGSVTVGFLFVRRLEAVLDSLERELVAEQQAADQRPAAAEIVVQPVGAFCVERLVIDDATIAASFVIEDIRIGSVSQLNHAGSIPADVFAASSVDVAVGFDAITPGMAIQFRVRYVGTDPRGRRFRGRLMGRAADSHVQMALPIDSGRAIVA